MSQEKANVTPDGGMNRAKMYQLALFPMNNGATNVYFILTLNFLANYGSGVLGLLAIFVTVMQTVMRLFDAVTDPIIGALIDKTNTKIGKFRPYMILGNVILAVSSILMYFGIRVVPDDMLWLRYTLFVLFYMLYVIGYTFQTACTRSGQACLTNDPNQRPMFTIFNTIASLIGMGLVQFLAPILGKQVGGYNQGTFYDIMIPMAIIVSALLTILAVIGIAKKDNEKYFGLGGKQEKVKFKEYIAILKENKELQKLMVAGASGKLAFSLATQTAVLCMLYGAMMKNYDGLFLPMMVLGYVFSVPFFALTVRTSQKHGQSVSLVRFTTVALIMYVAVFVLLCLWDPNNPATQLSLYTISESGFSISLNWYTILFVIFFGLGYGAYYTTADMPIPMVADCSDYETYRSGKYVPGIMGTLFSLVDKLASAFSATILGIALLCIGINTMPDQYTPYAEGMNIVVIVSFCVAPMLAWILTLIAMRSYKLTGPKMKEIQAINLKRKEAIEAGMSMEEAMAKYVTLEDIEKK